MKAIRVLIVMLVVSCNSTPSGYLQIALDHPSWARLLTSVQLGCAEQRGKGSFAAVLWGGGLPSVQFDGAWSQRFEVFRGEVTSPIGEPYAQILVQHQGEAIQSTGAQTLPAEWSQFLTLLGSHKLRELFCAGFLLSSQKVYLETGKNDSDSVYKTTSNLQTDAGEAEITARVQVGGALHRKVEISAEIVGGSIFKRKMGNLFWSGTAALTGALPTTIKLDFDKSQFNLTFSDFD